MADIEIDEIANRRICVNCIGEAYLAHEIGGSAGQAVCHYCSKKGPSTDIGTLSSRIEQAFSEHYVRTSDQPESWQERHMGDRESDYYWEREGTPIDVAIQDAAGLEEEPAADVLTVLQDRYVLRSPMDDIAEEYEFDFDSHYQRRQKSFIGLHMGWHEFEQSLKIKARFFSSKAEQLLARIFGGADKLQTKDGRTLVIDAGPGTLLTHVYRARVFHTEDGVKEALCVPSECIGSPPPRRARAGRMNAQGISVFYGATKADVAIAEVRPAVGSWVVIARFDITRRLRLLDLTAAGDIYVEGSVFDTTLNERLHRAEFLRSLRWRMGRAVMPDDEGIDYLPTQAVADFLANANEPRLDGIIFPSVQVELGFNVVLFHESARVARDAIPNGCRVEAYTGFDGDDGWETKYSVIETVPSSTIPLTGEAKSDSMEQFPPDNGQQYVDDSRCVTLQLATSTIEVHQVSWVKVKTLSFPVHRHRAEGFSAES